MDIHIRHLSYTYHPGTPFEHQVLQNVHLHIAYGHRVALVGRTGAGKSTLVQHMNGLLKPTQGSVQIGDVTIGSNRRKHPPLYKHVGMVFQYPEQQLFEETVFKDVAYGPKNLGWPDEMVENRVRQALTHVGLEPRYWQQSPFALSGGQKRRAAIAGILAMQPNILILDEPTAGLDPLGRQKIMDMLSEWQAKDKRTLILITHQMEDVAEYTDEVIVLHEGKLKCQLDPLTLFTEYADQLQQLGLDIPRWIELVSCLNRKLNPPIQLESCKKADVLRQVACNLRQQRGMNS